MILFVIADSLELISSATLWCFAYQRISTPHQGWEFRVRHLDSLLGWRDFGLEWEKWCPGEADQTIQVHLQDLRCWLQVDPMLAEQLAGNTLVPLGPHSFFETKKTGLKFHHPKVWASDDWPSWHQNVQTSANLTRPKYKNCVWQLQTKNRIEILSFPMVFCGKHMSYCKGCSFARPHVQNPRPVHWNQAEACLPSIHNMQTISFHKVKTKGVKNIHLPHTIHGTVIFTYIYHKNQPNVGK